MAPIPWPTRRAGRNAPTWASPRSRRCWKADPRRRTRSGGRPGGGVDGHRRRLDSAPVPDSGIAMRTSLHTAALLAVALALAGCRTLPAPGDAPQAAAPAQAVAVAADDNLNAVLWLQRSMEYRALSETVFRAAAERLDAALA